MYPVKLNLLIQRFYIIECVSCIEMYLNEPMYKLSRMCKNDIQQDTVG